MIGAGLRMLGRPLASDSSGAFCFCGSGKALQPPPATFASRRAPKLLLDDGVRAVRLFRIEIVPTNWPGDEVGQLEPAVVLLLADEQRFEVERLARCVLGANTAELQLQFIVFALAAALEQHVETTAVVHVVSVVLEAF